MVSRQKQQCPLYVTKHESVGIEANMVPGTDGSDTVNGEEYQINRIRCTTPRPLQL